VARESRKMSLDAARVRPARRVAATLRRAARALDGDDNVRDHASTAFAAHTHPAWAVQNVERQS
jgi:hypothetical protein